MQKITRDQLVEKAVALLEAGTVSSVLGWGKGEFDYDVTPAVFTTAEELKKSFVFNDFCGANFSKYLVAKTAKTEGKILVFLKPCDTYSFNQLLTEHRFDREKAQDMMIDIGEDRKRGKRFATLEFSSIGSGNAGKVRAENVLYCDDLVDGLESALSKERMDKLYIHNTTAKRISKSTIIIKDA